MSTPSLFPVCGVLRREALNFNDLAPYIVYRQDQPNGQPVWKVRGPGQSEVYPWPSHDAAVAEVRRLQNAQLDSNILRHFFIPA